RSQQVNDYRTRRAGQPSKSLVVADPDGYAVTVRVSVSTHMRSSSTSKWLRPAIGLIAAYAIALQTILAGLVPLGAAAFGDESAIICHGAVFGDDAQPDPDKGRADHHRMIGHCALCAITPLLTPSPADIGRPVAHPVLRASAPPARVVLLHDIHERPG